MRKRRRVGLAAGWAACLLFLGSLCVIGQTGEPVLTNGDVVAMVQAGLDESIVVSKIEHSTVAFDCSTEGLVALKNAGVPPGVVKAMIARPAGPPPAAQVEAAAKASPERPKASTLKDVAKVTIRADSEVLRITLEERLKQLGGPVLARTESEADAVLSFATDCGAQTVSLWSGANFCTCEGSLSVEADGARLWTTMERERSANAAKSSKKLAESLSEKFVAEWRQAKGK